MLKFINEGKNFLVTIVSINYYRLQAKAMSCCQCAATILLVSLVVGVQGHQIIYVDTENGSLDNSCWEGGLDQPCGSLELADTGAQKYNSTIAVVVRYGTRRNSSITGSSTQAFSYRPIPITDNDTCSCGPTESTPINNDICRCDKVDNKHKYSYLRNTSCPPWFKPSNGTCICGESIDGIVKCNESLQESAILDSYCITYNKATETVVVGACIYNCINNTLKEIYRPMSGTVEQLNEATCGCLNRSGQLCGECRASHSPPVYSYNLHCMMCSGGQYNWIKYITMAFVPLTVFLVLVLCCRISATSPQLYAFVMFSQLISSPNNVRALLSIFNGTLSDYSHIFTALKILLTVYGIWNLDFFRTLIPHMICLELDMLQVLALDYSIAFYPLALIIIAYVLIELHAHNFRAIVWVWRPFHRCSARFRQQWDIKTSIIDAFATFLLLSSVKFLSVSFDLLTPNWVYNMNGSLVDIYLYYDASVKYFGTNKHLPYAILAVFVLLIFVILPILLLLMYPLRCFRWCLGRCRVRWHALHTFIDAFQGYYKDGTNGTRDCRYFAGVYFFVRLALFILLAVTRNIVFYALAILLFIGLAMLLAIVQPYRAEFAAYNVVDIVFVLTMAMWCGTMVFFSLAAAKAKYLLEASVVVSFLVGALPVLYLVVVFLRRICLCMGVGQRLLQTIKSWMGRLCRRTNDTELEGSLPHRLISLHLYRDGGDTPVTNSSKRFSNQVYFSINNDETTV